MFFIFLGLGWVKFWFPFQILNLGGTESQNSISGGIYALGQVIGYLVLSSIITRNNRRYLAGVLSILLFLGIMVLSPSPEILLFSRILEGLGFSMIFLSIIQFSGTMAEDIQGETLGSLFSAVFSGLAIGQGLAGLLEQSLGALFAQNQENMVRILSLASLVIVAISYLTLRVNHQSQETSDNRDKKLGHTHLHFWRRAIFGSPAVFLLFMIYGLYDFAHGIYTPNLSIMLNQQGISEVNLGFAYFVGDFTWGISQIFAGKWIDRIGYGIPLIASLILKGLTVVFYAHTSMIVVLFLLLFLAGLAEGFLEPARNKAALTIKSDFSILHYHGHLDIGFSSTGNLVFGRHKHDHDHEIKSDQLVAALQTIGMIFFGIGSLLGSWLLTINMSLQELTYIGGIALVVAGFLSAIFNQKSENSV